MEKKALQQKAKGLGIVKLPRQDGFRNFCMSYETDKVYQKLEEVVGIREEVENNKKAEQFGRKGLSMI